VTVASQSSHRCFDGKNMMKTLTFLYQAPCVPLSQHHHYHNTITTAAAGAAAAAPPTTTRMTTTTMMIL